ncbi:MAG: tRNA (guanosine(37)-N1)-methyltransferase TrmD [Clostridia bacterium]|nr:tRNA (guanosine(37)-N1)-methyltransferase TrmD [Clostridia bacterium]
MKISILTLFPEMFTPLEGSIIGRARNSGKIEIETINIRDYSTDKHRKCDDAPFGGGAGMLMTPQPIADCITAIDPDHKAKRIYLSPKGKTLNQKIVRDLASGGDLVLLCGHYEGVDQRIIDLFIDEEVSIGDYVLTGGELPAMVLTDAVARYVDGVISSDSLTAESFSDDLLEYPQYTRPQVFMGLEVPEVLLNGNHKLIDEWRRERSLELTKKLRPDILKDSPDR